MAQTSKATDESDEALLRRAEVLFNKRYGRSPRWIVAAPGRVNLIGEHIDYNDGFVLPMAIERHVVIAADRPSDASTDEAANGQAAGEPIQIFSTALRETASFTTADTKATDQPAWHDYVRGTMALCGEQGLTSGPLEMVLDSSVPLGGGLSSSAALEVATATLLESISGRPLDPVEKALLCQKAEHEYAGVPCGIMDQFSITLCERDHLMLLDCRTQDFEAVPMTDESVAVLVINSNVKHELTGGEYAERRRQCEEAAATLGVKSLRDLTAADLQQQRDKLDDIHYRRARHVVTEIERTSQAAKDMAANNWAAVGEKMVASHASLRDDYEVSCPELDLLVELALNAGESGPARGGVIGSRMTGGGFGGCTVTLAKAETVDRVAEEITRRYQQETGIAPSWFTTRPAAGARLLRGEES